MRQQVGRCRQPARRDAHAVDADPGRTGRVAQRHHSASISPFAAMPLDVVPVHDAHVSI
jgi:hypothetical protein